jgi:hypothetical protein
VTVARLQVQKQPATLVAHGCGITPRSRGAPTAGHQARAGGTLYIFTGPGLASYRRRPLSSNVMPHTMPSCLPQRASGGRVIAPETRRDFRCRLSRTCPRKTRPPVVHPNNKTELHVPLSTVLTEKLRRAASRTESSQRQRCRASGPASPRLRASAQATSPLRWSSSRLAQRAAGPWRSPQRRSTATALPSAETGWQLWRAVRNSRPRSWRTGAA